MDPAQELQVTSCHQWHKPLKDFVSGFHKLATNNLSLVFSCVLPWFVKDPLLRIHIWKELNSLWGFSGSAGGGSSISW